MWTQLKVFMLLFVLFPVLDYLWIGKVMNGFYLSELGALARREGGVFRPLFPAAGLVYLFLSIGVLAFVLSWVEDWQQALRWGALLGFVVYGVYDSTNMAILQNYTWRMTVVDIGWGTVLCGTVSALAFGARGWLG